MHNRDLRAEGWGPEDCYPESEEIPSAALDGYHLLPCPFCGGMASFGVSEGHDNGEYIQCQNCLASSALVYSLKEDAKPILAEKWNRRA